MKISLNMKIIPVVNIIDVTFLEGIMVDKTLPCPNIIFLGSNYNGPT